MQMENYINYWSVIWKTVKIILYFFERCIMLSIVMIKFSVKLKRKQF